MYNERSRVIISKNIVFLSLKIDLVVANSADPDEMTLYATFHLVLHCLPYYSIYGSPFIKLRGNFITIDSQPAQLQKLAVYYTNLKQ